MANTSAFWSYKHICLMHNVISRHVPRSQKDPRSWIPRIQDPGSCGILDLAFSLSHGILKILDPVTAILPWDPRDLGSRTENILLDPGDPGSSLSKLSWDLADLGSCTTIRSLHFEHLLQPMAFCFWFPISIRCWIWALLRISTTHRFIHSVLTWKQAHLAGSSTSNSLNF